MRVGIDCRRVWCGDHMKRPEACDPGFGPKLGIDRRHDAKSTKRLPAKSQAFGLKSLTQPSPVLGCPP